MKFKMIEVTDEKNEDSWDEDRDLPICFNKRRHVQKIEGMDALTQSWRMKDRMKTVSVALVLCLNVGVDPPDIVKIQPCCKLECWIDPSSVSPQKALELIGSSLQKQYERWQPRARYKQFLDPTVEDVKKLCTSLRRNAKEERVLFHYNGHGVPRPTVNGEIWVFNRNYTQYIPLSIYELQNWMGAPSIYVYDCSNAGIIVNSFNTFAEQHERELEQLQANSRASPAGNVTSPSATGTNVPPVSQPPTTTFKHCIQLAACAANQILPMNPQLPADLFTSCLSTPLKIALKWYTLQATSKLVPQVTYDLIEKIPGQLNDRRTMLGELNWIFTAITDTIAWNTLPRELFQKLFRQDLLVASLFRNFLLAERILRSYDCTPVSSPALPQCFRHPMWTAWDYALDLALLQLPNIIEKKVQFQSLPFFEEQLTAFQVWLERGNGERNPPEQLPIVLQVLLSQVHRLRALELLARFVDMGPWAVNLALSVGIFPYVLKLLQSSAKELRPLLVFIWAKILAVDVTNDSFQTCQVDLIRDQGHKYFLAILQDPTVSGECRTLSAFVLACIVHNFPHGQANAQQGSLVSNCLVQLYDNNWVLRQWLALCLGQLWQNYDKARWSGVRDLAHEKLYPLLKDPVPEVRAAAVFALGTFISSVTQRSEHANNIDRSIAMTLWTTVSNDMSPLVRMELISALQWMVILFENQFVTVFMQSPATSGQSPGTHSLERYKNGKGSSGCIVHVGTSVISNFTPTIGIGSIYMRLYQGLIYLSKDPFVGVQKMALKLIDHIRNHAVINAKEALTEKLSYSLPPSPNTNVSYYLTGDSPPRHHNITTDLNGINRQPNVTPGLRSTRVSTSKLSESGDEGSIVEQVPMTPLVTTNYFEWAVSQFARPSKQSDEISSDIDSPEYLNKIERCKKNAQLRQEAKEQYRRVIFGRLDNQVWHGRTPAAPALVRLHPYEDQIAVAYRDRVMIKDWSHNRIMSFVPQADPKLAVGSSQGKVSSIEFINSHMDTLVLAGYDDGFIRVWCQPKTNNSEAVLITSWLAIGDNSTNAKLSSKMSKSGIGLVTAWHQKSQTLVSGGESRVLNLWDVEKELKSGELLVGSEASVRVLSMAPNGLLAAGCGDGSVRIFDKRISQHNSVVITYREHSNAILTACLRNDCESLVSGCDAGAVRLFDIRRSSSIQNWNVGPDVSAMAIHSSADIMVCGSQIIKVFGLDGKLLGQVRSHEGFMGPKVSLVSCLSFHPYKVSLSTGFVDNTVSVFMLDNKKQSIF